MAEPLDLNEIFEPYSAPPRMKKQEDSSIMDVVKNAFKEGKGGYVLGGAGLATAGWGVKKSWDKSLKSSLAMVQEAAKAEGEAIAKAKDAGFRVRPVTLNRPLVGNMAGAVNEGVGLPVAEAEQLALAKDVRRSRWLRPFGLGQYADSALTPKLEITPRVLRVAGQGEPTLGLTQMTVAETPRSYVVPADRIPEIVAGSNKEYTPPTAPSVGQSQAADMPAPRYGLPYNNYQKMGRALFNAQYGNAGIPLNSASNIGKSLFKSGAGIQAIMEGATAAYDTWPEFLGGSGNNVYGRTVEELRRGVNPETDPFAYNYAAPFGGVLANAKRWGWGAGNAGLAGIPWMVSTMTDISKEQEKVSARLEAEFEKSPEKFSPAELERQRLRRIEAGMATSQDQFKADTPEAQEAYKAKLEALKAKKEKTK